MEQFITEIDEFMSKESLVVEGYLDSIKTLETQINVNKVLGDLNKVKSTSLLTMESLDLYPQVNAWGSVEVVNEGLWQGIKNFIEMIIAAIQKMIDWFKSIFTRIEVELIKRLYAFNKIADEFRACRYKETIVLSPKAINYFNNNFLIPKETSGDWSNYFSFTLDNPSEMVNELINKAYLNVKEVLDVQLKSLYIAGGSFGKLDINLFIGKTNNEFNILVEKDEGVLHLEKVTGGSPTKVERGQEIKFVKILALADDVDKLRYNIKNIYKNYIQLLESSKKEVELIKSKTDGLNTNTLKNIMLIQNKAIPISIKSTIKTLGSITKFLRYALKNAAESSSLGYEIFIKNKDKYADFIGKEDLGDINALKLVHNGEYLYIETKGSAGPFAVHLSMTMTDTAYNDFGYSNKEQREKLMDSSGPEHGDIINLGLIFMPGEKEFYNNVFGLSGQKAFDVAYWHEVGHIVTGQNERFYIQKQANDYNIGKELFRFINTIFTYIDNPTENMADAYSLLKTGIDFDVLLKARVLTITDDNLKNEDLLATKYREVVLKSLEEYEKDPEGLKGQLDELTQQRNAAKLDSNTPQSFVDALDLLIGFIKNDVSNKDLRGLLSDKKIFELYKRNVSRHIAAMRKHVKLGLLGYMRSLFFKIKE